MSSSSWGRNAKNASIWDHSRLMIKLDYGIIHECENLFLSVILSWTVWPYRMWKSLRIKTEVGSWSLLEVGSRKKNLLMDLTLWKSLFRTGQGLCVLQHMLHLATGDLRISCKFIFFFKYTHTQENIFQKNLMFLRKPNKDFTSMLAALRGCADVMWMSFPLVGIWSKTSVLDKVKFWPDGGARGSQVQVYCH